MIFEKFLQGFSFILLHGSYNVDEFLPLYVSRSGLAPYLCLVRITVPYASTFLHFWRDFSLFSYMVSSMRMIFAFYEYVGLALVM